MSVLGKFIYPCLMAVVVLAAASQGQAPGQSQRIESNQMFYQFPANSVQCSVGDYIITRSASGGWKVYLVGDLFFMSRLLTMRDSGGLAVVEQVVVADSATPPKWREIQLLVTEFGKEFRTPKKAIESIESGRLGDSIQGLCRSVDQFRKERSQVYKKQ